MIEQPGRRERKKAATRKAIADTALRMFLERGYDAVGIREIAAAADVAITTLFAHFPSKEALVFDEDQKREDRLIRAVTGREPGRSIPQALRQQLHVTVREFARPGAAPFWRLVDSSPALREYASTMWLRHRMRWPPRSPPTWAFRSRRRPAGRSPASCSTSIPWPARRRTRRPRSTRSST